MGCKPSKPRSADSNEWNAAYEQSVRQVTTRRKESVKTVKKGDVRRGSTGDTIVVVERFPVDAKKTHLSLMF